MKEGKQYSSIQILDRKSQHIYPRCAKFRGHPSRRSRVKLSVPGAVHRAGSPPASSSALPSPGQRPASSARPFSRMRTMLSRCRTPECTWCTRAPLANYARRSQTREMVASASSPHSPYEVTATGTHVQPSSWHLASFSACLRSAAEMRAAELISVLAPVR